MTERIETTKSHRTFNETCAGVTAQITEHYTTITRYFQGAYGPRKDVATFTHRVFGPFTGEIGYEGQLTGHTQGPA